MDGGGFGDLSNSTIIFLQDCTEKCTDLSSLRSCDGRGRNMRNLRGIGKGKMYRLKVEVCTQGPPKRPGPSEGEPGLEIRRERTALQYYCS